MKIDKFLKCKAVKELIKKYPIDYSYFFTGCYKHVYGCKDNKHVIAFTEDLDQLEYEIKCIKKLRKLKLPVIKFEKVIYTKFGAVILMKKYDQAKRIIENIKKQLRQYKKIFKQNKIYVQDLQCLMDKDKVVFIDPLDILNDRNFDQLFWFKNLNKCV